MTVPAYARRLVPVAIALGLAAVVIHHHPALAAPPADKVLLAPHRAVYDLKLSKSQSARGVQGVRGRILYDFSGNACDGYELQFRQVSELDSGEGKAALSDQRKAAEVKARNQTRKDAYAEAKLIYDKNVKTWSDSAS